MKKAPPPSSLPVQQLILGAAGLVGFRWRALLIASVSFALVSAVAATFADARVDGTETEIAAAVGIPKEELQKEVSAQMETLSESDLLLYVEHLRKEGFSSVPVTKDNLVMQYIVRTGPYVFGLMIFDLAVLFVCFTFFLFFFGNPIDTAYETAQKLLPAILRMTGVFLWVFLRSYVWIPFVGPFIAVYMFPRLALAPAILASGETGILGSVALSYRRTQGQWVPVFARLLVLLLIAFACLWVSIVIAGSVGLFLLKAGFFLWLLGVMATIGFLAALLVVLGAGMR